MNTTELYDLAQTTGKGLIAETNNNKLDAAITEAATAGGVDNADLPLFKRMATTAATNYRHLSTQKLASEIAADRAAAKKKQEPVAPAGVSAKTAKT